ncbi:MULTISPECIES: hypothetical protein [Pseudoalteromonas]|uniref:hypothetical protein n=1 Tax=Pseudoalteromonas TaxID=53246 RepID=UPI00158385ED|nr:MULTISPECIES: hypothetical protein [Pseudoalteromonas]MDI4652637.1 hypothetical protein [Pseudoalteromonas shioyasakiensis]NUJ38653.1 hypothetical protein [Pseudoalteromonas sp. 0303]
MSDGYFFESPEPTDKHVKNYLELLGAIIKNNRLSESDKHIGMEYYIDKKLTPYFGKSISRKTLAKAESGSASVAIGIHAAIIDDMGLWPELLKTLSSGRYIDARYITLVIESLKEKEVEDKKERLAKLHKAFFNEIGI